MARDRRLSPKVWYLETKIAAALSERDHGQGSDSSTDRRTAFSKYSPSPSKASPQSDTQSADSAPVSSCISPSGHGAAESRNLLGSIVSAGTCAGIGRQLWKRIGRSLDRPCLFALPKNETGVRPTEAEAIGYSNVDPCLLRFVGDIVAVEVLCFGEEIDSWRHDVLHVLMLSI